jgi:hypothetical protein
MSDEIKLEQKMAELAEEISEFKKETTDKLDAIEQERETNPVPIT